MFGVLALTGMSFAQPDKGITTDNQNLLYKSAEKGLFIIRQDYILITKDDKKFGKENKDYYGRAYTLAVMSDKKLWCNADIRTPWLKDPGYETEKNNETYKPVLSKTYIRPVTEKEYKKMDVTICPQHVQDSLFKDQAITFYTVHDCPEYINIEKEKNITDGWLVLAYTYNHIAQNDTADIIWSVYQPHPVYEKNETAGKIKEPPFNKNIIGGIYFKCGFSVGSMKISTTGIFNKKLINYYIAGVPAAQDTFIPTAEKKSCWKRWTEKRRKMKACKKRCIDCTK